MHRSHELLAFLWVSFWSLTAFITFIVWHTAVRSFFRMSAFWVLIYDWCLFWSESETVICETHSLQSRTESGAANDFGGHHVFIRPLTRCLWGSHTTDVSLSSGNGQLCRLCQNKLLKSSLRRICSYKIHAWDMTLVPDYVMLFAKLFNKKQKHNNRINQKHNCSMMVRSCLIKVCILICFKFVRNVCVWSLY